MNKRAGTPRNPVGTTAWRNLKLHHKNIAELHMQSFFAADPQRPEKFALELDGLYIDYAKHRVTDETMSLLLALAAEMDIPQAIRRLVGGDRVNNTEQRPALHTALRAAPGQAPAAGGENITSLVREELARMEAFIAQLHSGAVTGGTGNSIKTLVNIGIGGADLGPRLVTEALMSYGKGALRVRFVANADPVEINSVLAECDPATTLFVVSSKTFTTTETLANARYARNWLRSHGCPDLSAHFVAVTANSSGALHFGIRPERIFHIWNWVGGRFSVWSAVGIPAAAAIGMDNFRAFLAGARAMDMHFCSAPLARNLPVILALLDIWYINFFHCETLAIIPYAHDLKMLPRYLGQLFMESNGKSIRRDNRNVHCRTASVIWGDEGTNAQHALMQLLHQGTHLVPVDFLAGVQGDGGSEAEHRLLLANCIAQGEALMAGNTAGRTAGGQRYKIIAGNKPSTTILYERLTPETLGKLLALYEHRAYVQACLWNINAFDQWGVELGKTLAAGIGAELESGDINPVHDASTRALLMRCLTSTRK